MKHCLATVLCLAENVLNRNAVFSNGCIFLKPQLHAQDLHQCVNLDVCKFTLVCKCIFAMRLHGFNLRVCIFN